MLLNTHRNANIHLVMNSFEQTLFHDKIFSVTFPWLLTTSLTFPWHVSNSLTFPVFPDKWSPWMIADTVNSYSDSEKATSHKNRNSTRYIHLLEEVVRFAKDMSEFGQIKEVTFQSFGVWVDVLHLTLQAFNDHLRTTTTTTGSDQRSQPSSKNSDATWWTQ